MYLEPDEALRTSARETIEAADRAEIAAWMDPGVYGAVRDWAGRREPLEGEDKRLLDETLRHFREAGMQLDSVQRDRLRVISERLSELSTRFNDNLQNHQESLDVEPAGLEGVPGDVLDKLERLPDGRYRVGLDYPVYEPVMRYARSAETRRLLQFKFQDRAAGVNVPLLQEALGLRQEAARLLGYENFAEKAIAPRMAKTRGAVDTFLARLQGMIQTRGRAELDAILQEKRREEPAAGRLEAWDLSYYSEKLRRRLYDLDSNEVKPYFPAERVVSGTLAVYQKVLGLKFTEVPRGSFEAWHPDASLYEVHDAASGERLGHFYLDLHPRPGKFKHAAVMPLIIGRELPEGGRREPVAAMMANFTKPGGGQPSLLRHGEVETFFHEFGHVMHDVLSRVRHASQSRVARDFVEAPSQMLENFVWEPEVLFELSGHWQDPSRKLPPELLAKMLSARRFNKAIGYLYQVALASLDLAYHTAVPEDATRLYHEFVSRVTLIAPQPGTHPEASFGHLLGGYAAGYYGYLWSEVFAQDIFSRFKREGVMNPAVGMDYRRKILEPGSRRPEADSLSDFLGREPNADAFMEELRPGEAGARDPPKVL